MLTRVMGRRACSIPCSEGHRDPGAASRARRTAAKQPQVVLDRSRRPQRAEQAAPSAAAPAAAGL